jgi:hypothetical protein
MTSQRATALLLTGWVAVALGIAVHDGRYTIPALVLVVIGTLLVAAGVLVASRSRSAKSALPVVPWVPSWLPRSALAAAALTVGLSPLFWHPRYFAHGAGWAASQILAALAGLLAAATVVPFRGIADWLAARRWPFWVALGLMAAAGVTMIMSAPKPHIDVFFLLQGSTKGLLSGDDMYRQQWAETRTVYLSHGLFDVYPYLPWTSVLLLPFRVVFGDVRYGLVLSLAIAAVIGRRLGHLNGRGVGVRYIPALLPLLVALYPKVTYGEQLAWTEPLLIALLAGMVLAVERGRLTLAVGCLALALASKQHIVLVLPLTAIWPRFGWRRTLAAAGGALLLISPWIIAGPRDFWHDAVSANVGLGYRNDALCLATFFHKAFGVDPGFALTGLGLLGAYLLAWRLRGDAFGFCAGAGVLVLALDITNTQSFFNHYTLGMALVALAICLRPGVTQLAAERGSALRGEALQH